MKVIDGPENRVVFIGMDQCRDELLYSNVKGKNPFKDVRVRQALYQAVDIETMKTKLMNGQSCPDRRHDAVAAGRLQRPGDREARCPSTWRGEEADGRGRLPDGFEVTLDCPNNRYINDEEICIALASMWAKIEASRCKVVAMPRVTYFPKLEKLDTSMYMLGWGGAVTDAETTLTPVLRNLRQQAASAPTTTAASTNAKFDELAAQSSIEADPAKRKELIKAALARVQGAGPHDPAAPPGHPLGRAHNVEVVHRADNWLEWAWVTIGK